MINVKVLTERMNDLNIEEPLRMRLLRWVHITAEELEDHL